MKRFSNFQEEYLVGQLLEQMDDGNPFDGIEDEKDLPDSPSGQSLWKDALVGSSTSKPKYWMNFYNIITDSNHRGEYFQVMSKNKKKIIAYVQIIPPPIFTDFFKDKNKSNIDDWKSLLGKYKNETFSGFNKGWEIKNSYSWSQGDDIGDKIDLSVLNKDLIKDAAFSSLVFDDDDKIEGRGANSSLYTSLYEQLASITLIANKSEINGILGNTNALTSRETFNKVLDYIKSNQSKINNGKSLPKISEETLAYYYVDALNVIQGAWNFRNSSTYSKVFGGSGEVIHGDVDGYYKRFRSMAGGQYSIAGLKKNTADSVYMSGISYEEFDTNDNIVLEEDSNTGIIEIKGGTKKGYLLQLSLKKGKDAAQGGKVLRSFTSRKFYTPAMRQKILDTYQLRLENYEQDRNDVMYLEERLLEKIADLGKKGVKYVRDKINKVWKGIQTWAKKLFNRWFNTRNLNAFHKRIERSLKRYLPESVSPAEFHSDLISGKGEFWNNYVQTYTSAKKAIDNVNFGDKGKFLPMISDEVQAIMTNKSFIGKSLGKDTNDIRFLISNMTTFEVIKNMMTEFGKSDDFSRNVDYAIEVMANVTDDIKVGESKLAVIKLYGVEFGSGEKSWEVVSRKGSVSKIQSKITEMNLTPILGILEVKLVGTPTSKSRKGYLVTYLYILAGVDDEGKEYFSKAQMTSDTSGYKAETSANFFYATVSGDTITTTPASNVEH